MKECWFGNIEEGYRKGALGQNGLKNFERSQIKKEEHVRSSHWRCSVKKDVLKNFANFARKHLRSSHFLTKLQAWSRPATLLKKDSNTGVFLWICDIFKNTYFEQHLGTTASNMCYCLLWEDFQNTYMQKYLQLKLNAY